MASAVLAVSGMVLVLLGLLADFVGLGSESGIGASQIAMAVFGGALVIAAIAVRFSRVGYAAKRVATSGPAISVLGLLAGLLIAEAALQIVRVATQDRGPVGSPVERFAVEDARLGLRVPPNVHGHDSMGFRNDAVPERVEIVAIGDSQTWGINVHRSEAWPQVLGKLSGRSVYNISLGGFGPAQYWVLMDEALRLDPDVIVIGLYFGNDLWDAYHMAYANGLYTKFSDPALAAELSRDTVGPVVEAMRNERKEYMAGVDHGPFLQFSDWLGGVSAAASWLKDRGLWFDTWIDVRAEDSRTWAQAFPDRAAVYESEDFSTTFTTAYRLLAMDTEEPRIAEGLRVTKELMKLAKAKADQADVRLLVLLFPTKESVYAEAVERLNGPLDEVYAELVRMEARTKGAVIEFFETEGIEFVDALSPLAEAVERGEPIYPRNDDSHPVAAGYRLVASTVNDALAELGW